MRKRFVEEGYEAALEHKKRETPPWIGDIKKTTLSHGWRKNGA